MALEQTGYQGDENIGFYGMVTEEFALFAPDFPDSELFAGTQVHDLKLNGTAMVGLFAAGNSNGVVVSDTITPVEKRRLENSDVPYLVLESKYTAIGNLLLCNDNGCVVSPHLQDRQDAIASFLDVPVKTGTVAGLNIPGSCGVATNNGVLLHRDASEDELDHIEDVLGVGGDIGSVNFGSPYVRSGILATTTDLLAGPETTGPEMQRVQDALGFLD